MKRGEIWLVNLDPTIGAEIKKTRPAVIVSNNAMGKLPLRIIVPITAWNEKFRQADWHVFLQASPTNGLSKDSSADTFQVRSISERRLVKRLGKAGGKEMQEIQASLMVSLDLNSK